MVCAISLLRFLLLIGCLHRQVLIANGDAHAFSDRDETELDDTELRDVLHGPKPGEVDETEIDVTGSRHGQMPSYQGKTNHIITDTVSSPAAETHPQSSEANSSQTATEAVIPPEQAAQSSEPAAEAAAQPQAADVDVSSSQTGAETEPVQPLAEPAVKVSVPEADGVNEQNKQAENTEAESNPPAVNAADQQSQPTVDSQANSQHSVEQNQQVIPAVDELVSDSDHKLTQDTPISHREVDTEVTDSDSDSFDKPDSSDKPPQMSASTGQHDLFNPASDAELSQPAAESALPASEDDVDHQQLAGENTEEQTEQLMTTATEPTSDVDNSQQQNVDYVDKVVDKPDELVISGDVKMQLHSEDSEGLSESVSDEQFTAADDDKGSVGGYLAPLVNLWAAVDAWLMTCIDSMPIAMQKLFINAPVSLSPQHSLLVFVSACFTLCLISASVVYQWIKQWGQQQEKLDVCDRLYTVESARLVAEQENEDLHRELDLVNTRLREMEAQSMASGPEVEDLIAERDGLKATVESQLTEVSHLQSSVSQKTDKLTLAEEQVGLLRESLNQMTQHTELIESQMLELQSALHQSQSGALEMQSQLQSMTEEISILQTSKDRLVAETEGSNEKMQDMAEQISKLTEAQQLYQDAISLKERELSELCQCFYQLKSFEAELVEAVEKSDEDEMSNSEQEDADHQLTDDSLAADGSEQLATSAKQTQSQAAHDALQEKIKDMINVAHVNAKLNSVEEECECLRRALSVEVDGRRELEGQLKDAETEIAKVMQSRQEAEQQISASKVKMEVLSNIFKDKEKELMRKLAEQEARERASTDQLTSTDIRTREFENMVHLYKEQVEDLQKEIQKIEGDYRRQVAAQEKKAHENWLSARQSERQLKEQKSEAQLLRQKIVELQNKLDAMMVESQQTSADESAGSNVPSVSTPVSRRPFPVPRLHDGFLMRPRPFFPVPPPPLLDGRPLPPNFPPPRLPMPMVDRQYADERSPFDPAWLPPPLPGRRSPPYMDRYSPRDDDRSPSSFHSSIPPSGSSASLSRSNVASTSGNRSSVKSPPVLVDRGPPHIARPRPEFGVPSPNVRGPVKGSQPPAPRNDEQSTSSYRSYSPL